MRKKPFVIGGIFVAGFLAASAGLPSIASAVDETIAYSKTVTFRGIQDVQKYILNSKGRVTVEDNTIIRKNFAQTGGHVLSVVQRSSEAPTSIRSALFLKSEAPLTSPNDYLIYSKKYGVKVNGDIDTPGSLTAGRVISANGGLTVPAGQTLTIADGALVSGLSSSDLSDAASIAMISEAETITGNWVNTANPWAADEIADITRAIPTQTTTWYASTGLPATTTTPNLVTTSIMLPLEWDSGETTQKVMHKIVVPADYSSGLTIHALVDKQTITTNDETMSVRWASANASTTSDPSYGAEDPVSIPNTDAWSDVSTALDRATVSAGDHLIVEIGMNAINETTRIQSLWFTYTAKQ